MGIQIINGGFLTTIQDMGRYGYQETGMSVSGVMDTRAASLANILVGNDTNEAVIEITMMGPTMKFTEDEIIAVTGGDLGAKIDGKPVERYRAVLVKAGQTLSFMGMYGGSRAAARKKPIEELAAEEAGAAQVEVLRVYAPEKRAAGVKIKAEDPAEAVSQALAMMSEAKAI